MAKCWKTALSAAFAAGGFFLLVLLPAEAADGARSGLRVCGGVIVPSLFPFLVFSGLFSALGLTGALANAAAPVFRLVGISAYACGPLLIGLLGGYPVGASALAALVRDGLISPREAERLLPCCNNTGPAFIVGAAGSAVFGSASAGLGLFLCHVLAALTLLLLAGGSSDGSPVRRPAGHAAAGFSEAFPDCVRAAAVTCVHICGFVVFFSVLTALLTALGVFSALSAALAMHLGTELQFARALLTGILELGGGIAAMRGLPPTPQALSMCAFVLGFGGLSVHCQTLAVLSGTKIRCARHFVGRICHGALSALYAFLLFTLLRI